MRATRTRAFLAPGERIGRYEILTEIATGGMAVVYAARLHGRGGFGKLVAIKRLLPHLLDEREFVDMFLDEARIAACVHHPNVVEIFDLGEEDGVPFIVMEYVRGRSLSAVMRRAAQEDEGELSDAMKLHILASVAEGLHAAHEARTETGEHLGIVHRDVSPQNIHIGYDGSTKVVDFGIAAAKGRLTKTRSGHVKGKFHYMAPEQVRKQPVDRSADIWALGAVAWELFTGQRLFKDDDDATTLWNVVNKEVPSLRGRVPDAIAALVGEALDRNPYLRPESCEAMAVVFREAAGTGSGASELAAYMERAFGEEREAEARDLRSGVEGDGSDVSGAPSRSDGPAPLGSGGVATPLPEARGSGRRWPKWLALVAGLGLVTAMGWAVAGKLGSDAASAGARGAGSPPVAAAPSPDRQEELASARTGAGEGRDDASAGATGPSASDGGSGSGDASLPRETVQLRMDRRAKLVLVDGQRHRERPVEILLHENETATIEVFGPSGRKVTRSITVADDGERIRLPRPRRRTRRGRRARDRADEPARSSSEGSDILRSEDVFR